MDVRITVMKTEFYDEIAQEYITDGKSIGPCPILKKGDIFLYRSDNEAEKPEGFCPWAWVDLYPAISRMTIQRALREKGKTYWYKHSDKSVVCCTDGVRPVVFLLERLEYS